MRVASENRIQPY